MDADILTEVPLVLKKLIRLIVRGFFSMEHAIIVDMLVRHPCIKEDDLADLLHYEKRHLRSLLNTLKNEKFLKSRMRLETDAEGKSTRHSYYFISYNVFVNVVKYKLDLIRKKIEQEERNSSSRASFRCPDCSSTFTDFEVGQLLDFATQQLLCTFCQTEVVEDESSLPAKDARTHLARFNDQIQPIYTLLQQCEDVKLAPALLEPEPTDIRKITRGQGGPNSKGRPDADNMVWSGSASRSVGFGYSESSVTITVGGEEGAGGLPEKKEAPVWMTQSTVEGVPMLEGGDNLGSLKDAGPSGNSSSSAHNEDIMQTLLVHEPKAGSSRLPDLVAADNLTHSQGESSMQGADDAGGDVEEMESDDDDDGDPMVTIGDRRLAYQDVTPNMVAAMTPAEKEEYIRVGKEMYENYYE